MFSHSRFGRSFTKIFLRLILGQDSHQNIPISHMGLQHFYKMKIFFFVKRPNYPYYHPLPPTASYPPPPPTVALCQRYFWKCAKYSQEFNPLTKYSKKTHAWKVIPGDNIPENSISGNENSNLLPNASLR